MVAVENMKCLKMNVNSIIWFIECLQCAKCGKEAIFYCCWNTSYCDYPCQQAHWPTHMATCMQQTNENDPNKNQAPANQPGTAGNQNAQNRPNGLQPPAKSPMEIEVIIDLVNLFQAS